MPAFFTCSECGKDYLVPDEVAESLPDVDAEYETCCPRCFDLCYRATDAEKQQREAFKHAKTAE